MESEGVELFDPNEKFEMRSEALSIMSSREFKGRNDPAMLNPRPLFGANQNANALKLALSNIVENNEKESEY